MGFVVDDFGLHGGGVCGGDVRWVGEDGVEEGFEREEIAEYPEEEAEELALIYEARGVALTQAREVSQALLARPEQALDVLAREELGLNPDDLGSPWGAAAASFLSFAVGATVPLVPFVVDMSGHRALAATAVLTAIAL